MRPFLAVFLLLLLNSQAKAGQISSPKTDSVNHYLSASEAYKKDHNFKKAFESLRLAVVYAEKKNDLEAEAKAYKKLGNLYSDFKKYADTLDEAALDSLEFAKFGKTVSEKSIQKIQKENSQQLKAQQKENKFSKLISILSLALISILSLLSLSLYRNNIIRNQSNQLLKDKNNELQAAKDKAERASTARSEFLSTVSHELRTPLNAITGITHLLIDEDPKPSQVDYLNSLQFSGNYLLNYINEILEINRIESKKIEVERLDFDLKKLLNSIQASLQELANTNNNHFILEIDPNIPETLVGDPTKLSQIFMNLINNSLKFTKNGEVKVTAKLLSNDEKNASIHFEVIDNGIGIAEDKLESVFESFSQGSVEINRKYGGSGLGLTIVKNLIAILGGDIKLGSIIGKGSTFSFTLQFKISLQKRIEMPSLEHDESDSDFIAKKILLVEDNKINQMITKRMLEKKQVVCEIVENGEDAVVIAQKNHYDLILMDVHLPGINGTIATQQIREFDKTTPIVALTAISLLENREMLLSYGMNEVITKPFEPRSFFATIAANFRKDTNISESIL